MTNIFQKIFFFDEKLAQIKTHWRIMALVRSNTIYHKTYKFMDRFSIVTPDFQVDAYHMAKQNPQNTQCYISLIPTDKQLCDTYFSNKSDEQFAKRIYNKMQRKWNRNNTHVK